MSDAESLRQIAHSRAPFSAWFGTVLLFLLFGAIVLALVGPSPRRDHYEEARARKRLDNLKTLREADAKALAGYAWVDKAKGAVHIPIDRAMQLTMAELAQKKPAAAYPIASPAAAPAAPAAQPTAAPSPAPKNAASPAAKALTPSRTSSNTEATPAPKAVEPEGPKSEIRSQPAGAANPPNTNAGSQPGANSLPQASPGAPSGKPAVSPTGTPHQKAPASPIPVAGQTPTPTP
jgi:hypothetical protein